MKKVILTPRDRIKQKIRAKVIGTPKRPRMAVFKSNKYIYTQLIDDKAGQTLLAFSDLDLKTGTKTERAEKVGETIAKNAKKKKISQVVFDRGGFKFAGRIKALAEGARKEGLKF